MKYGVRRTILVVVLSVIFLVQYTKVAEAKRWFHPDETSATAERICRDGITFSAVTDGASSSDSLGSVTASMILRVALYNEMTLPPPFDEFATDFPDTAPRAPINPTNGKPYTAVDYGYVLAQGRLDTTVKAQAFEVEGRTHYDYTSITLVWQLPLAPGTKIVIEIYNVGAKEANIFYTAMVDDCNIASFPYQGYLAGAEGAADGVFDFRFTLYDAPQNGKPWGAAVERPGITVKNGYFITDLPMAGDLLATRDLFDNTPPWLEIGVRPSGVGEYAVLNPRQPLMPVPYAQYTRYAQNAGHSLSTEGITVEDYHVRLEYPVNGGLHDNAIEATSAGEKPTVNIQNTGPGNGVATQVGNANSINATSNSNYATIYAENMGIGYGIAAQVTSNDGYAAVYGKNSGAGTGGSFSSYSGTNILVAREEVTIGSFNTRFRVALNGDVYADGRFLPNGADFAEMLVAAPNLEPGDVLIIDAQGILNHSSTPNAPNVAGVYSTKPGIVGGLHEGEEPENMVLTTQQQESTDSENSPSTDQIPSGSTVTAQAGAPVTAKTMQADPLTLAYTQQNKIPLALVGIVPVKVSAENGLIQPGDLLTTSSTPGHAMKATPVDLGGVQIYRPGTIIGKALEPLASSAGVIRVLITLQ